MARRLLAKCMLVIMIRGLFNSLKFPYCQFPATSTKGSQLFPLLRHCIFRLTRLGLVIVSVTCDGASDNRHMFSLHGVGCELTYKTLNVFTEQSHSVLLIANYCVSGHYETSCEEHPVAHALFSRKVYTVQSVVKIYHPSKCCPRFPAAYTS